MKRRPRFINSSLVNYWSWSWAIHHQRGCALFFTGSWGGIHVDLIGQGRARSRPVLIDICADLKE